MPARRRTPDVTNAEPWRDALIRLSAKLPIETSLEELTREFLDDVFPLLPSCALGVCIVDNGGRPPIVTFRLPVGSTRALERDPSRLFPGFRDERVVEIDDAIGGSTLHVATDGPAHAVTPLQFLIAEQAALILGAALRRARTFARLYETQQNSQRFQAQVIQNEKLASLGQIVAGVVHELNNPLTSIIAYSDYLKRRTLQRGATEDVSDDLERLRRIGEAAGRILKFSRDLVAYARPSTDVPGPVVLQDVIDKALVFCEHEFTTAGIEVERDFDDALPPVRGIAGQLTQVFVNLFTNAAHAMSAQGGTLRVSVRPKAADSMLIVEVSDTGGGIDATDMSQIFEPFFTTKTEGRGTGLGLSIVRGIVDAHGGTIVAQSAHGEGTMFVITLPLSAIVRTIVPPGAD
jgi:signal transduction histidine kinase